MKNHLNFFTLALLSLPGASWAADAAAISPTGGVLKMVLGLAVVLGVMALITWALKRMVPSVGSKQSVVRVVGGVSVGSRERVVVLEVAGRWIVVGVAPGQVNQLANLEIDAKALSANLPESNNTADSGVNNLTQTFSQWLSKSTENILKKDIKN